MRELSKNESGALSGKREAARSVLGAQIGSKHIARLEAIHGRGITKSHINCLGTHLSEYSIGF